MPEAVPPQCQPLKDELDSLKEEREGLRRELQTDLDPQERSRVLSEFKRIGRSIAVASEKLSTCIKESKGVGYASIRSALNSIGVSAEDGLDQALQSRPTGLRELIRVATLPRPRLEDLEPDHPSPFESLQVRGAQGIAHAGGRRWFLSSTETVRQCWIAGTDPFHPTDVTYGRTRKINELLDEAGLPHEYNHIGDLGCRIGTQKYDFMDSIVYAPMKSSVEQSPHLLMGLSTDLDVIGWDTLYEGSADSACAVNPWNGRLYLPSTDNTQLEAYDIAAFDDRLRQRSQLGQRIVIDRQVEDDIQFKTPDGVVEGSGGQGVAFSNNGRIYVTHSLPYGFQKWHNFIYVYSALTGIRFGKPREWDFGGVADESEGIAIHPAGLLYVGVNNNDVWAPPVSHTEYELYAFRYRTLRPTEI